MTYRRGSGIIETPAQGFVTGTSQAGVRGTAVDIATFRIHEKEIDQICVKQPLTLWPPSVLEEGKGIILASIPGGECEEVDDNEVILINFRCWQKQLRSTNTRLPFRLIVTGSLKGRRMPPQDFDVGGTGAGLILAVRQSNSGIVLFPLAGVIPRSWHDYILCL